RVLVALAVVGVLGAGGVVAYVLHQRHVGRDVRGSPAVEFETKETPTPRRPRRKLPIEWPTYGFNAERVRAVDLPLRPPFRRIWRFGARSLLEFPPVIGYGRLYVVNNAGRVLAVNTRTGKRAWRYDSGRCAAASPALGRGTVYVAFLYRHPCRPRDNVDGEVAAFGIGFGKLRWRRRLGPSETSPLVANGLVYVGDWSGRVYALDEKTGRTRWTFRTGGEVKGGVALAGGRLYVGSYDGHVYALDARTGRRIWRASAQPRLGGRGTFYSTPAAAYRRVYIGSTDGKVYSFGALSGKLRWSQSTGGYVYASPAVWRKRILVGSYSGYFYALDAATGEVRWRFRANGPISGSATVIGRVVYFATLERRTYALDAATGRQLWTFGDGKYTPVVADAKRLYLVGYGRMYGMVPRGRRR
ncbi:MAG: PQQ-binding-like beta-propeller repeat protein, partial [Actinomycetota bacterium]|nr:PQQ-binding-like beta-propeller repeat protein [Actinomycetota bacterium]